MIAKMDKTKFVSNNILNLNTIVESQIRPSKIKNRQSGNQLHRALTQSYASDPNLNKSEQNQIKYSKEEEDIRKKMRGEMDILKMFLGIEFSLENLLQPELTESKESY